MQNKSYFVYILSNQLRTVLYVGISSAPEKRLLQHQLKMHPSSFSAKYNCTILLYLEEYSDPNEAIRREKEIKGWRRSKKDALIMTMNPSFFDITDNVGDPLLRSG